MGDSLLIVNSTLLGSNCDLLGNERPVAFIVGDKSPTTSEIVILKMGEQLPLTVGNAIAAGPNLVSFNSKTKTSESYIPAEDFNVNIWEHAASSAIGLIGEPGHFDQFVMVTADGDDNCARYFTLSPIPPCLIRSLCVFPLGAIPRVAFKPFVLRTS